MGVVGDEVAAFRVEVERRWSVRVVFAVCCLLALTGHPSADQVDCCLIYLLVSE